MSYNLGLCSISFRKNAAEEILKAMNDAKLTHIEWGSDVHAPKDNIETLNKLANLQQEYNVICSSYGTYFKIGTNPAEELEGYITAAKILGTNVLRLWCGNKNSQDYSEKEKAQLFSECKKLAEIAQKHNAFICMESHGGTFTNSEESALELIKTVNNPHLLMYWQPQQFKSFDENLSFAKSISPFVKHIHVFNWEKENRFPLKDGIAVWQEYLKQFEGGKTLLLEFMPDDKIETLKAEAYTLKQITR